MVGAIIPAAGRGTRMAAVTGGGPKELLPLGGRTVLDFVLDEALAAAACVCVVVAPGKPEVASHVLGRAELAVQESPRGFAHAVRIGIAALPPCDRYLVLLPDTLFAVPLPGGAGISHALLGHLTESTLAIAGETAPDEQVSRYGILEVDETGNILRIKEKPRLEDTDSRLAISARYAFRREFAEYLESACQAHDAQGPDAKELSLTPVIGQAISEGMKGVALPLQGTHRLDCGSLDGYAEAREVFGE